MLTSLLIVILLFVAGVVLLSLEAFVIPGFGVVGILGIAAFVGAAVIAWLQLGWLEGVASLVASVGVLGLLLWSAPRSKTGQAMILQQSVRSTAAVLRTDSWRIIAWPVFDLGAYQRSNPRTPTLATSDTTPSSQPS